jgi:ferredoxin-type protein NapH
MNRFEILKKNKWRYISFIIGFLLLVSPFALLIRLEFWITGNLAEPSIHYACLRMVIGWIFQGAVNNLISRPEMTAFIIGVLGVSLFLGPIFCGWLCPVGAVSEAISRIIPLPNKFRIHVKDTNITSALRYGFFVGYITIYILIGLRLSGDWIGSICCRFCASTILQNLAAGIFGWLLPTYGSIEYWGTAYIIVLISWLIIGGIFTHGGRGWCLFFCPLGAFSNLLYKVGAKLGFYRITYNKDKCSHCKKCYLVCPMWAIKSDHSVETALCINCKECVNICPTGAFTMKWGKENATK